MIILSQAGHGDGSKTTNGIDAGYIGGVIFRPRDISPDRFIDKTQELRQLYSTAQILFDPQLYAGILWNDPNVNFKKLDDYRDYFNRIVLSRLEEENNVKQMIRNTLEFQKNSEVTSVISPNIIIRRSLDSRESVISKSFIRNAINVWREHGDKRKLYVTLAISRDALLDRNEFTEFLNDITSFENPPDGFYILIAANSDSRFEILNSEVISAWLMLNYSLIVNGFDVINGYSDILSPFMAAVGAQCGSTGWWANSRTFSLEHFIAREAGGSLPVQRYYSKQLLNRIRFDELRSWYKLVPDILNHFDTDEMYLSEDEPERAREVLQSWETLTQLSNSFDGRNVKKNIEKAEGMIHTAILLYSTLSSAGIRPDQKSNSDHLEPILEGLQLFKQMAEI